MQNARGEETRATSRMPTKKMIVEKAKELYAKDCFRTGSPELAETNPEIEELNEDGYLSAARSELMRNPETKYLEDSWKSYNEQCEGFKFDSTEAMQTTTFVSGSRGIGKSDITMYAVDQLKNGGIICVVFDSSLDWLKRSSIGRYVTVKPYTALDVPNESMIFDISLLTPMEQQRTVESFCKKLFESQLNNAKRFYVVFEEAQLYFPLNSMRGKNYQHSARLLTVGRNVNVSICAISQFPALVDKELVKHSGQIYIGYCSEPNTLNYWKGILGKKAQELKELQNGNFLYYCRSAISKIQIDPYENTTAKEQIVVLESKPIELIPTLPKTQPNYAIAKAVLTSLLLIAAIAYGLSQMV